MVLFLVVMMSETMFLNHVLNAYLKYTFSTDLCGDDKKPALRLLIVLHIHSSLKRFSAYVLQLMSPLLTCWERPK